LIRRVDGKFDVLGNAFQQQIFFQLFGIH
jgi:hypothetical protein